MTSGNRVTEYSLQSRLLISFSILLFVFLGLTGIVLDSAFRNSIEAGAADRLQVHIYLILAAVEEQDGEFYFLEDLQEPRFGQLNSGLYGFISQSSFGELWRSDSAIALNVEDPDVLRISVEVGERVFTRTNSVEGEELFVVSYGILWQDGISEYSFTVMEDAEPYYSEISNFRASLWYWLGGVAVLLLLIQFLLLRWGLLPLHRMANDLKQIESGTTDKLQGVYPRELRGVTRNLNILIETERKQQSRYRTTLGDLAHSLKTPLAIISSVISELADKSNSEQVSNEKLEAVEEQIQRMNQIVSYQLQRAVQSNRSSLLMRSVNASAALNKVLDAIAKVYADKQIRVTKTLDETLNFYGDERDLLEVLGNVLDNSFKYGKSQVAITLERDAADAQAIHFIIEDDGPGIDEEKREYVLQRGARADTLVQGQGIGLAVVTDIIASYEGSISIDNSQLGGVRIKFSFAGNTV